MPSFTGQAFTDIGKSLPGMVRSNREAEEDKRLKEIREKLLAEQLLGAELSRTLSEREAAREVTGRETLHEALRLMKEPQQEPVLPEVPEIPELGSGIDVRGSKDIPLSDQVNPTGTGIRFGPKKTLPSVGGDTLSALTEKYLPKPEPQPYHAPLGPKEALLESGAGEYLDVPSVEAAAKQFDPYSRNQSLGGGATGARLRAATEEDRIAARATVEGLVEKGLLTPEKIPSYRQQAETDPIRINDMFSTKDLSVAEAVRQYEEITPLAIERTGGTAAASTASRKLTERKIQKENPILSEAQGGSLSDAYNAVDYLNQLKKKVQSGDIGYFDIDRKTGQFLNPEAADAFLQMVEIVGRKRSGAAISEGEWKNFGKQILNKNNLLSEGGRKAAIKSIDRYLDKFYGAGVTTTGNEDWYSNYREKAKSARSKGEQTRGDSSTDQFQTGKVYKDGDGNRAKYLGNGEWEEL